MLVMTKKTEDELKELIRLNMDAAKGFALAADRADDIKHASLFHGLAATRQSYEITLRELGRRHGADVAGLDTHVTADVHRAWIEAIDSATDSDEVLLRECLRGEEQAKKEYEEAQAQHMWPERLDATIRAQHLEIIEVKRALNGMREQLR